MPKTTFQRVIFTLIMAAVMVYLMGLYNASLNGGGLQNETFLQVFEYYPIEYPIAFVIAFFIGSNGAEKLTARVVDPKKDNIVLFYVTMAAFNVCIMASTMSLVGTIEHHCPLNVLFVTWLQTFCLNFIAALPLQVFVAGPLVRFVFRKIFCRESAAKESCQESA